MAMKKAVTFLLQVIFTTIIYTAVLYLWQLFDHETKQFDWTLLVQGLIFSILYVPLTNISPKFKFKRKQK